MAGKRSITLPEGAAPTEWQQLHYHEVEVYRREGCPHYSLCLSYAAERLWEGFTCIFCPFADKAPERSLDVNVSRERGFCRLILRGDKARYE